LVKRSVVKINKELCDGCGRCVVPCAEGAITIVNGKARVLREELCDGLGFCVGICPTGALSIREMETEAFDQGSAEKNVRVGRIVAQCFKCGTTEKDSVLFPVRSGGRSEWVCAKCIPPLIHG